ncbi:MAG: winged helix-turn-helix transcriptional regulator [Nitrososphaerota archaeon]|nr:winged helix-turn-helix transcriptional regulator [Nitrososphaerota archaeon]MDG7024621.1 winged helix-turn-helix transcriptional regulator [Nitrososphaerota archaeon]
MDFVKEHPGTHLRAIKRELNLGMGTVQYHLYTLERESKVVSRRKGLYKRFYASNVFGERQQEILGVLSQEPERDILLYLVQNPNSTQKALADYAGMSPGTINWHMKRLHLAGLVEATHEGQFVRYVVVADRAEILRLLKVYHPGIWERLADRLADVLGEIGAPSEGNEEEKSP